MIDIVSISIQIPQCLLAPIGALKIDRLFPKRDCLCCLFLIWPFPSCQFFGPLSSHVWGQKEWCMHWAQRVVQLLKIWFFQPICHVRWAGVKVTLYISLQASLSSRCTHLKSGLNCILQVMFLNFTGFQLYPYWKSQAKCGLQCVTGVFTSNPVQHFFGSCFKMELREFCILQSILGLVVYIVVGHSWML